MVPPEWSPNESYLRKFERLGFALVRSRPEQEHVTIDRRRKNQWLEKCTGLAGPFALALLVAIPYVAENSSGPIIVAALLLAALDAALTVWCYTDFEAKHGHCTGDLFTCLFTCVGEFPAFLTGWWWIQAQSSSFAACARALSSIVDSVTGRHVNKLLQDTLGGFTPLGAPVDVLAVGVTAVPTIMCSLGMEESRFLRLALLTLSALTSMTIFGSALDGQRLTEGANDTLPLNPDPNLYAKIMSGASLASIGFLGLYSICNPDNLTLTQHQHFLVVKRFSITGCVVSSIAFLFYFIESTVLNKVQSAFTFWDGDPPLLWPLEGGWRIAVASLGIAALAIATFEFLIPMTIMVTKMANDGLLYGNLRKEFVADEESSKWNPVTPLVFGGVTAVQALLIDTKTLLGLATSSLLCIHIIVCASMLALRYQSKTCFNQSSAHKRAGNYRTRPRNRSGGPGPNPTQTRRLLTVSFLKNGMSKITRDISEDMDIDQSGSSGVGGGPASASSSDRTFLMDDVCVEPIEPRESTSDFSIASGVSGYESDTEPCRSDEIVTDDTDVDAAVKEYQEQIRVATLNGILPMSPTPGTARRVAFATVALIPSCIALAASLNRAPKGHLTGIMLAASSGLLTFLLMVVISRQPQRKRPIRPPSNPGPNDPEVETAATQFLQYSIIPWLPAAAIFLHCCLLLEALDVAGSPFAVWLSVGLTIYFSYGVFKSIAAPIIIIKNERLHLSPHPRQSVLSTVVCGNESSTATTSTSNSEPFAQIDTVLIS